MDFVNSNQKDINKLTCRIANSIEENIVRY